jgi:hypothetical protein
MHGDNLLAEFGSVVDAVSSAMAIQSTRGTKRRLAPGPSFRMGINIGEEDRRRRPHRRRWRHRARGRALAGPGGPGPPPRRSGKSRATRCPVRGHGRSTGEESPPLRVYRAKAGAALVEGDEHPSALTVAGSPGRRRGVAFSPLGDASEQQQDYLADGIVETSRYACRAGDCSP